MALTLDEKRIRRARRAFEDAPDRQDLFLAWSEARKTYLLTPEGAVMLRLEAMEFLRNARFMEPTVRFADGYAAAASFLRFAALLDYVVDVLHPTE